MSAQFLPELLDTSLTILNEDFPLSFFLQVSNCTDSYPVTLVGSLNRVYLHRKETDSIYIFFNLKKAHKFVGFWVFLGFFVCLF